MKGRRWLGWYVLLLLLLHNMLAEQCGVIFIVYKEAINNHPTNHQAIVKLVTVSVAAD